MRRYINILTVIIFILFGACSNSCPTKEDILNSKGYVDSAETAEILNNGNKTLTENQSKEIENGVEFNTVTLTGKAIVVISYDTTEIEKEKARVGEENFYVVTDDWSWYSAMLIDKADSLQIPMTYVFDNKIKIKTPNSTYKISKDSLASVYTYIYFDGKTIKEVDLLDLIDKLK